MQALEENRVPRERATNAENMLTTQQAKVDTYKATHAAQLQSTRQHYEQQCADLARSHAEKLATVQAKWSHELTNRTKAWEARVKAMERDHAAALGEMQQRHEIERNTILAQRRDAVLIQQQQQKYADEKEHDHQTIVLSLAAKVDSLELAAYERLQRWQQDGLLRMLRNVFHFVSLPSMRGAYEAWLFAWANANRERIFERAVASFRSPAMSHAWAKWVEVSQAARVAYGKLRAQLLRGVDSSCTDVCLHGAMWSTSVI